MVTRPALRQVARLLLGRVDEVSGEIAEAFQSRIPYYAALPADVLARVRRNSVRTANLTFAFLDGREPTDEEIVELRTAMRERARQGVPFEALLESYAVAGAVCAARIRRLGIELDVDADDIARGELAATRFSQRLGALVAAEYLGFVRDAYDQEHRRLTALVAVANAVNESLELDEVTVAAVASARNAMSAPWAAIRLDGEGEPTIPHALAIAEVALSARGRVLGSLWVGTERELEEEELRYLEALAVPVAYAVAQSLDHRREARTDFLSGLANRGEFDRFLRREVARAERYGTRLSLAVLDLDRLKAINDAYGHAAGDSAIRHVAETLRGTVRAIDLAARIGGDEFGIVMPEADASSIGEALARFRHLLGDLSISAGIAEWRPGMSPESLFAAADANLYASKR